jgi:hypothetical protein
MSDTRSSPVATGLDEKNGLARFLERSPIITLATTAVTISGVIYGIVNYVASQKIDGLKSGYEQKINQLTLDYENKAANTSKEYYTKLRLLEEERSRINFTIKGVSSFIDTASIFMDEVSLPDDYKRFRSAHFAVPLRMVDSTWSWRESDEAEMITEAFGVATFESMFTGEDAKRKIEIFKEGSKIFLFEGTDEVEAIVGDRHAKLKARCIFQSLTKENLDATSMPRSMQGHYLQLFTGQYNIFLIGLPGISEGISLDDSRFVIKGYVDFQTPSGGQIRYYFLRIGIRTADRIFNIGYMVPTGDNLHDVRIAMSMVSGFRILK